MEGIFIDVSGIHFPFGYLSLDPPVTFHIEDLQDLIFEMMSLID